MCKTGLTCLVHRYHRFSVLGKIRVPHQYMVQVIPVSITGNTSLFSKYTCSIARVYPFTFWYLGSHNCMDNKCSIIQKQAMYLILNTKRYQEISLTISCPGGPP